MQKFIYLTLVIAFFMTVFPTFDFKFLGFHLSGNSESHAQSAPEKPAIFEYKIGKLSVRKNRHDVVNGGQVYIYPDDANLQITQQDLASTCVASANFFIDQFSLRYGDIDHMLVVITDVPYDYDKYDKEIYYGKIGKLGMCHNLRSTNGAWQIIGLEAASRNTTSIEKQIEQLWLELRASISDRNRESDSRIKKVIAERLGINIDDIAIPAVIPQKLDARSFKDVDSHGPLTHND